LDAKNTKYICIFECLISDMTVMCGLCECKISMLLNNKTYTYSHWICNKDARY